MRECDGLDYSIIRGTFKVIHFFIFKVAANAVNFLLVIAVNSYEHIICDERILLFQRASEYLPLEGIGLEDSLHLYDYWARLEMELGNDLKAARDVWESLLKKRFSLAYQFLYPCVMLPFIYPYIIFITGFCSGTIFEFWKGYLDMEIRLGKTNEARSIYKRCYSKKLSGNGSEVPFEIVYCGYILLLLALVALVFIILIRQYHASDDIYPTSPLSKRT